MQQAPERSTPVPDYLEGYDPAPVEMLAAIETELRLRTNQEEIPVLMQRLLAEGKIIIEENVSTEPRQLMAYIRQQVAEVADARQQRIDARRNGEVSNGKIKIGDAYDATVTQVARGNYCKARIQTGDHDVSVHIGWDHLHGTVVRPASQVRLIITQLPSKQYSYSGELVHQ